MDRTSAILAITLFVVGMFNLVVSVGGYIRRLDDQKILWACLDSSGKRAEIREEVFKCVLSEPPDGCLSKAIVFFCEEK